MHTLIIRLPEEDQQRRALLRVLQDTDYRLPYNTAHPTVTLRLPTDRDFWTVYAGLWAMQYTCDAAPKALAGLRTAVETVLDELEAILDTEQESSMQACR